MKVVAVRLNDKQVALLRQIKEARAMTTMSAALGLCIVETHSLFFGKDNTQAYSGNTQEVGNEQAEA